ncbi:MAG TPA: Fe2+-enterobactin ABC transporter substrate-binding protein [Tahibacter sp.]|uniref:Fe2+-enterobactin ABC transporter substrate-binding protein n=1 Tax=Tahibacter sp. TaxID=2056211 RepID=UPI002B702431|nr:Fe2+-enterobactin ABC transporter substrate-binding protein [Tahibacter sp.]HSX61722.1 Fe2+-enterobactin ABC transporter substrate-binding protein [Tahibacter sp.]
MSLRSVLHNSHIPHRGAACLLAAAVLLSACTPSTDPPSTASHAVVTQTSGAGWPRTIDTPRGALTLARAPQRIVSTSVTLTGTLLTIDAPVVASGATRANSSVSDTQGFFRQWGDVAQARGVTPLYQGEADAEAIVAAEPDLVVIAGTGGDSALKLYDQLAQVAPVLVVNYDDKSWQELAVLLGRATGRDTQAAKAIDTFAADVARTRAALALPPQPVTALAYYEDDSGANLWTSESAQGRLLADLGFTLAPIPDGVRGDFSMGRRKDIVQLSGETFPQGLTGATLLLFSADDADTARLRANPFLAANAAVQAGRVHALGTDTFRLDYYSSRHLLARLRERFH